MNTLVLSRTSQPEADRLAGIGQQRGWIVDWLDGKSSSIQRKDLENAAVYAETDIALSFADANGLALIEPSFDLLTKLPIELTKRHIAYKTLLEAKKLTRRSFVKPADCRNKAFEAAVCESGADLRVPSKVPADTPVIVSEPVLFDIEYRTVILNRELVTLSPYIRNGRFARNEAGDWPIFGDELESVKGTVNQLFSSPALELPPVFVLDVGFIENRGWAVIEFNPVWCSGFLGCDLTKLIDALDVACWKRHDVPGHFSHWIVSRPPIAR